LKAAFRAFIGSAELPAFLTSDYGYLAAVLAWKPHVVFKRDNGSTAGGAYGNLNFTYSCGGF